MTVECCVCGEEIHTIDDGNDLVSHGIHPECGLTYYGEDFAEILEGEPT